MKKFLICLVLLFVAGFFSPKQALATYSSRDYPSPTAFNLLVKDITENILGRYDKDGNLVSAGAITFFAKGIDSMASAPPATTHEYFKYLGHKFHIPGTPTPAYAADEATTGVGYQALTPILPFWTAMRNLAYFFFAIFFVISGIMVMIRSRIDPKTAATIQSVLPKIIIALVLVTFSYAIAGFLIDIMYVSIGLVITIATSINDPAAHAAAQVISDTVAKETIFSFFLGPGVGVTFNAAGAVTQVVSNFLKSIFGEAGGAILGLFTGSIAFLIIAIAVLWALFQVWLLLIKSYAYAVLSIIFAPLRIMFDAIPGQNQFEGWIREMLSFLLVWPAVIGLIFITLAMSKANWNLGNGFVPPLIGGGSLPAVQALLAMAMLLTMPKILEILQQILKAPPSKWGTAWGEALGVGRGVVGTAAGGSYTTARDLALGNAAARGAEKRKEEAKGGHPVITPAERVGMWTGAKPRV